MGQATLFLHVEAFMVGKVVILSVIINKMIFVLAMIIVMVTDVQAFKAKFLH